MSSADTSSFGSDGKASPSDNNSSMRERAAATGRKAADTAKRAATRQAQGMYDSASNAAADTASETSSAIDDAASALQRSGHETLSQAAAGLAERMRDLSGYLKDRSLEDCMADARALAKRNPALFIGGGIAIGFALSRFFKASGRYDASGFDSTRDRRGFAVSQDRGA
ncbi:MAG TPA: hypothetical protein VFO94_06725 [Gammaproteobacteria bacterium]|nr:hypothetical protein [Gammaproteobacteria bacterium]